MNVQFRNTLLEKRLLCASIKLPNPLKVSQLVFFLLKYEKNPLLTNYMPPKTITAVHIFPKPYFLPKPLPPYTA